MSDIVERLEKLRTGDVVFHKPSEETWVVAWADNSTDDMAPCGWPTCMARISDCELVTPATDEKHAALVEQVATSGRTDAHRARALAQGE